MTLSTIVLCALATTGIHQRWVTEHGPIHTWYSGPKVPTKVVLYVHGYYDSADSAFEKHRLADQFASSGLDTLFVVPEAPSGAGQSVSWLSLEQLLAEVAAHLTIAAPASVLVLGHSGGHRTIKSWLGSPLVNRVILLDGLYGDPSPFEHWLARRNDAQLVVVSQSTLPKATAWLKLLDPSVRSRVSHRRATCSHMQIVTDGWWIPEVLREIRTCDPFGRGRGSKKRQNTATPTGCRRFRTPRALHR